MPIQYAAHLGIPRELWNDPEWSATGYCFTEAIEVAKAHGYHPLPEDRREMSVTFAEVLMDNPETGEQAGDRMGRVVFLVEEDEAVDGPG